VATSLSLEVHTGDHDLLDYCTFGVEAANDAQNARETQLAKKTRPESIKKR